jgi:hypothetical protein
VTLGYEIDGVWFSSANERDRMHDFVDIPSSFDKKMVPVLLVLCEHSLNLSLNLLKRNWIFILLICVCKNVDPRKINSVEVTLSFLGNEIS